MSKAATFTIWDPSSADFTAKQKKKDQKYAIWSQVSWVLPKMSKAATFTIRDPSSANFTPKWKKDQKYAVLSPS